MAGNYQDALSAHEKNIARGGPVGPPALCWAAASYTADGQNQASVDTVAMLTSKFPDFRLSGWNFLKLIEDEGERDRVTALMRQAGIPE